MGLNWWTIHNPLKLAGLTTQSARARSGTGKLNLRLIFLKQVPVTKSLWWRMLTGPGICRYYIDLMHIFIISISALLGLKLAYRWHVKYNNHENDHLRTKNSVLSGVNNWEIHHSSDCDKSVNHLLVGCFIHVLCTIYCIENFHTCLLLSVCDVFKCLPL